MDEEKVRAMIGLFSNSLLPFDLLNIKGVPTCLCDTVRGLPTNTIKVDFA